MAAPTSVRVEATSITTTVLRWSYGGSNQIAVFRSTDGSSYSEITSVLNSTRVAVGTTTYTDTDLSVGTKYWYKLSDDGGSTFSSVVTVYTHCCNSGESNQAQTVYLPDFPQGEVPTAEQLNEMQTRITDALIAAGLDPDVCLACPVDGALVINCNEGCQNFAAIIETDVNSVSFMNCENFDGTVDLVVPPNVTVGICGFPAGFGFTGDECNDAPISGGTQGRVLQLHYQRGGLASGSSRSRQGTNKGVGKGSGSGGSGGGGGGAGCTCVPSQSGALTIKSCNPNNSLNCSTTKSLRLIACGGRPPYTWSKTGSITLTTAASGNETTVTPPSNSGSSVAGEAYRIVFCSCSSLNTNIFVVKKFKCDDTAFTSPNCSEISAASAMVCGNGDISSCCVAPLVCNGDGSGGTCTCGAHTDGVGACTRCSDTLPAGGKLCDVRTAGMISDGCAPCGLMDGSTVTVEDALGTQVTIIVRA